jgi:hypothetical protein
MLSHCVLYEVQTKREGAIGLVIKIQIVVKESFST